MSRRGEVLALVQAGGQGSRMDVLTRERAKPALPFGGVHRLIDFALSGLVHADLSDVWVSLEYQVTSIDDYLSGGRPWSLDRNRGGFRRIVPQTGTGPATESGFAHGNGDLLLRMSADIESFGARTLAVCSADHVFNMDLAPVIEEHVASGRVATVLTSEVAKRDASDNVVVLADEDGTITGVEHKPARPSGGTVATEIFLYDTEVLLGVLQDLRRELSGDEDGDSGIGDFGEHLLPRLVETGRARAVPLTGYWRDVGQPSLYLQSHRDLLAGRVDVFDHPGRPVISHWPDRPAARVRASGECRDSVVSPGADVGGLVVGSVLGPGVVVEKGAEVHDSVVMEDCVIRAGAVVRTAILDERCEVVRRTTVGSESSRRRARDEDLVLVGRDSRVDLDIAAGARLEPGSGG
ncbi:glucose-1-phosphate adenylyltransferase [Nocardioides sp. zg-1308]|uniref:Sugar phosphate nucleotidyltransferase n=1 Tax=Nocardioides renjunii TaxID=3095075 RepID=A0ABU5KG72_9ACTN|nr:MULTISPECIES: sugar phosphate nucleotidyltransferase [unclassified Nocardioides]MDZ5663848.1 sugar phosphate nucleotidyltransferase [Nocardioides sp. S-58]NPD06723.1 glucose-1-phosphate adenylyltransferase [Nocardioides sp. zg-1308]